MLPQYTLSSRLGKKECKDREKGGDYSKGLNSPEPKSALISPDTSVRPHATLPRTCQNHTISDLAASDHRRRAQSEHLFPTIDIRLAFEQ
jgi:hypothetical protein